MIYIYVYTGYPWTHGILKGLGTSHPKNISRDHKPTTSAPKFLAPGRGGDPFDQPTASWKPHGNPMDSGEQLGAGDVPGNDQKGWDFCWQTWLKMSKI